MQPQYVVTGPEAIPDTAGMLRNNKECCWLQNGCYRGDRCSAGFAKGSKAGRGSEVARKIADIGLHSRMPEALEVEGVHLLDRVLGLPSFKGDPISCEEYAGAVAA